MSTTTDSVPTILARSYDGIRTTLSRQDVFDLNASNYLQRDILIDGVEMDVEAYDPPLNSNRVTVSGTFALDTTSAIPELPWDHMSTTLYAIVITRAARPRRTW